MLEFSSRVASVVSRFGLTHKRLQIILFAFLFITVLLVFLPLNPLMPDIVDLAGAALNLATSRGLIFGKDIIFTYGPYASAQLRIFDPAVDSIMLWSSFYLALFYCAALFFLMKKSPLKWVLAFTCFMAIYGQEVNTLFFSCTLILSMVVFRLTLPSDETGLTSPSKMSPFYYAFLCSVSGLLPLIKGTYLIISILAATLSFLIFLLRKNKIFAAISILVPLFSMILFWSISGQQFNSIYYYFVTMFQMFAGYTEALALPGNYIELLSFLVASGFILYFTLTASAYLLSSRVFLFASYSIFLFIAFKDGFVSHPLMAGTSILIAAILFPVIIQRKNTWLALVFSIFSCCFIVQNNGGVLGKGILSNLISTYSQSISGIVLRARGAGLTGVHKKAIEEMKQKSVIPDMPGTTDVYALVENPFKLLSKGGWSFRPTILSFAAYTPRLARINEEHLTGLGSPQNIVFNLMPIFDHFPSLEDGLSWPTLIHNYVPFAYKGGELFLHRRSQLNIHPERVDVFEGTFLFGSDVPLKQFDSPLFAQIEIHPTLWGRLVSFLFKTSELVIKVDLLNGSQKIYRLGSQLVKSGFIISPLIETTEEFGSLYDGGSRLKQKAVKSIQVTSRPFLYEDHGFRSEVLSNALETIGGKYFDLWDQSYQLKITRLQHEDPIEISQIIQHR